MVNLRMTTAAAKKKSTKSRTKPSTPKVSPAVLTPELLESQIAFLEENDLSLCFDLRLLGKDGEVFQVKGISSMPGATRSETAKVVPGQFEKVVTSSLLEPLLHRFNDYVNEQTDNTQPEPARMIPAGLLDGPPAPPEITDGAEEENVTTDPSPDPSSMSE